MKDLTVDPDRLHCPHLTTGIYVRAKTPISSGGAAWGSHDISELTSDSLLEWLHKGGECNKLAENTLLLILEHKDKHE